MSDIDKTLDERNHTHGDFSKVSATVQTLKGVLHRAPNWEILNPAQKEALEMDCAKTARILCGNPNEVDHWDDKAGYATLGARACAAPQEVGPPKFLTNTRSEPNQHKPAVPFTLPKDAIGRIIPPKEEPKSA
jgi:hypothetical protein